MNFSLLLTPSRLPGSMLDYKKFLGPSRLIEISGKEQVFVISKLDCLSALHLQKVQLMAISEISDGFRTGFPFFAYFPSVPVSGQLCDCPTCVTAGMDQRRWLFFTVALLTAIPLSGNSFMLFCSFLRNSSLQMIKSAQAEGHDLLRSPHFNSKRARAALPLCCCGICPFPA